ncbi:MAG: MFS transporter [bacterium]
MTFISSKKSNSLLSPNPLKPLLLSSAGMFLDGYSLTIIAFAIILINPYFHLSASGSALVIGSVIIGSIIGAVSIGKMGDLFGRKSVYIANMAVFIIFGILSAVSSGFLMLFISRFFLGIAIGADYPISNSYITEAAPEKFRGKYLAFAGLSFSVGSIFSSLVAASLFPLGIEAWRFMLGIGVIPAAIVMILRVSMPESRRWLDIQDLKLKNKSENKIFYKGMFSKNHIKNTVLYSSIWFLYDTGAYGVGLLIPLIFKKSGLISDVDNALITSAILFIGVISAVYVLYNIDGKIGRKGFQLIGFIGMGLSMSFLPFFYHSLTGLAFIILIAEIFNSFPGITVGMFPAELSHTAFRSSAYGFAAMMGKLGAVAGVLIVTFFVKKGENYGFYLIGAFMLTAFFLSYLLPETKTLKLDAS